MTARPISVIVPTLNEAGTIEATLEPLREPEVLEVIVVDGGSEDGTPERAARFADRVLHSRRGRGLQMNAGADAARGQVLFFLHADTGVPSGFGRDIVEALSRQGAIGGRFDVTLDASGLRFRFLEWTINTRSRLSRIFTGDHGLFVRSDAFGRLGGYPETPLFEDIALSTSMKRAGPVVALRSRVRTSARRWTQRGYVRTILLMYWLRGLYSLGVPPERLARIYANVR